MILFIKLLLFSLVLLSNVFQLQAFTFNMYSGRGTEVVVIVLDKSEQIIQTSDLLHEGFFNGLLFLTDITARRYCGVSDANTVRLVDKKFKSYEC